METNAVTFGRMNLPHPGHVHLIKRMLESSTVIRYLLEIGEERTVRDIYHGDSELFRKIQLLRQEELNREKS
jgi:hypothetical protein